MTEKPNFFKLGLFVLLGVVLLAAGLILFSSGVFGKEKQYYETYFAESVHGLSRGSAVTLNGVEIGIVEQVGFVLGDYELPGGPQGVSQYDQYIRVVFYVLEEKLPRTQSSQRLQVYLDRGLRLRLASNLITGQAYLEGVFLDPERFAIMDVPWTPRYTYVPSAPSAFRSMQNSLDSILRQFETLDFKQVVDNVKQVLASADRAVTEAEIGKLSSKIQRLADRIDQSISEVQVSVLREKTTALMDELRQSNRDLQALLANPDPEKKLDNLAILIDQFNRSLGRLDELIIQQSPEVEAIMQNIEQMSENLNYLSERLKDNPSEVLFSRPPARREEQE